MILYCTKGYEDIFFIKYDNITFSIDDVNDLLGFFHGRVVCIIDNITPTKYGYDPTVDISEGFDIFEFFNYKSYNSLSIEELNLDVLKHCNKNLFLYLIESWTNNIVLENKTLESEKDNETLWLNNTILNVLISLRDNIDYHYNKAMIKDIIQ